MATVTKKELVDRIADNTKMSHAIVQKISQSFLDEIINELAEGNRLEFRDFGIFSITTRSAHTAHNPQTMKLVQIEAKKRVKFKVGKLLMQKLNNGQV